MFARRESSPILPPALISKNFHIFLSGANDCTEDIATFTVLVKINSTEYFCNTREAELIKNFSPVKIFSYTVLR